jgi:hypothetical protein
MGNRWSIPPNINLRTTERLTRMEAYTDLNSFDKRIALFSSTHDPYRDPLRVRMQVVPAGRLFIGMSNAAQHALT